MNTITLEDWTKEGIRRFGEDMREWKFICPKCKETQTLNEFLENKVEEPDGKFYFSCIGRFVNGRGCNWTLGGLFQIHETEVIDKHGRHVPVFEFAKSENPIIQPSKNPTIQQSENPNQ